jgi:PIN domain nuclease of toxin-antitoxin system
MAVYYVVDTHALIWYITGNSRLGVNAKRVLDDLTNVLILPAIAFAEACWIVERGKTPIRSVSALVAAIDAETRLTVVPLDRSILDRSLELTSILEMHDRQIVATTLRFNNLGDIAHLLTRDENIAASGLVSVIW